MSEPGKNEPAIVVENINKTFGARNVLSQIALQIEQGEMVALIGPSGSGKSTLLKHISGLVSADRASGDIRIFGRTVQRHGAVSSEIRAIRSEIGFIFQQFNLVGRLSLLTNVLTGMLAKIGTLRSLMGWFSPKEKLSAMHALNCVGLLEYADQRASTLSGGQQQRAAIARAIKQHAHIILADEPIASLDPESARLIMECLSALNRSDGVTVLISLHQVQFALQYCPRSIALRQGKVVYDGPSTALSPAMLRSIYGLHADQFSLDGTTPLNFNTGLSPQAARLSAVNA